MKKQNGITLVTLVTTIILLSILAGTISISIASSFEIKKYNELKENIEYLEDKIAIYYLENGEIPIKDESVNICELIENYNNENVNYNPNNSEILYKIDLEKIDCLNINNENYYIDEQSHTIYCENPVKYNDKTYFTSHKKYTKIQ